MEMFQGAYNTRITNLGGSFMQEIIKFVPYEVLSTLSVLQTAGYDAFLVGGCIRDCLMGRAPHDWDITTSAMPEQVLALFRGLGHCC